MPGPVASSSSTGHRLHNNIVDSPSSSLRVNSFFLVLSLGSCLQHTQDSNWSLKLARVLYQTC
ncbi:hypothetical protein BS78_01G433400 [Paspalum vaginatum]|nr:hypothetical protein BS78_01G433400 [Paspalum vaginatum]